MSLRFSTLRRANMLRLPQFKNPKGEPAHSEPDGTRHGQGSWFAVADSKERGAGRKNPGFRFDGAGKSFQSESVNRHAADSFGWDKRSELRNNNSKSPARKAASARIAKIPYALSEWIARTYKPARSLAP